MPPSSRVRHWIQFTLRLADTAGREVPGLLGFGIRNSSGHVYQNNIHKPTPVPYMVPPQGYGAPFSHSLTFDACFESGNLLRAVQRGPAEYDLFLRADLHTEGI